MKNFLIILISFVIIFGAGYIMDSNTTPHILESSEDNSTQIEIILENFKFTDINSKEIEMSQFKGKIVILNFWASWCAPCIEEFPEIMKVLKKHKKDVVLIAISNDEKKKNILKFMKKFKIHSSITQSNTIIGFDPKRNISSGLFNVVKLPESFILNRNGNIIKKIVGADSWTNGEVLKFIDQQI